MPGMETTEKQIEFKEFEKVKMEVISGNIIFENKKLKSPSEMVVVNNLKDGSRVG